MMAARTWASFCIQVLRCCHIVQKSGPAAAGVMKAKRPRKARRRRLRLRRIMFAVDCYELCKGVLIFPNIWQEERFSEDGRNRFFRCLVLLVVCTCFLSTSCCHNINLPCSKRWFHGVRFQDRLALWFASRPTRVAIDLKNMAYAHTVLVGFVVRR